MKIEEKYMDQLITTANSIVNVISYSIKNYDRTSIEKLLEIMCKAYEQRKKIVVSGEGNSASVSAFLVRRGIHLNLLIWFLQDAGCPALEFDDIAIFISGTGTTSGVVNQARMAHIIGAKVVLITSKWRDKKVENITDAIQDYADLVIEVGGKTKEQITQKISDFGSRQLAGTFPPSKKRNEGTLILGSQFEINALTFVLSLSHTLMELFGQNDDDARRRHRNIE